MKPRNGPVSQADSKSVRTSLHKLSLIKLLDSLLASFVPKKQRQTIQSAPVKLPTQVGVLILSHLSYFDL